MSTTRPPPRTLPLPPDASLPPAASSSDEPTLEAEQHAWIRGIGETGGSVEVVELPAMELDEEPTLHG